MKKTVALILSLVLLFSMTALSAMAMTPTEMDGALNEIKAENPDTKSGMMIGWDFDDLPTVTNEYAKDAYLEAQTLAGGSSGRYILDDIPEAELGAYGIEGLLAVRILANRDRTRTVTVYKLETLEAAGAYAEVLLAKYAPEEGEEAEVYVRQCGYNVVEGERTLAELIGVSVVDSVVPVNNPPKDIYSYYYGSTPCGEEGCADCEAGTCEKYAIKDGAYTAVSTKGAVAFKTPDSAIRMVDGALIIGQNYKNYYTTAADLPAGMSSYEGYMSADAYADIYPNNLGYSQLHEKYAGESFVFSTRVKAPYDYLSEGASGKVSIFTPRSNFTVKIDGVEKKVTFDQTLIRYDTATKEILIYSGGVETKTGIYLSEYEYSTVAVHVKPKTNTFDFYADGILVAEGARFLTDANIANIHANPYEDATGDLADYTLTRARVFHTSRAMLKCELLYIDNIALYYADEYLEKSENEDTVGGISVSLDGEVYMNYYLNFPVSYLNDYRSKIVFTAGERTQECMLAEGELITGGKYDGALKYTFILDADDFTRGVSLSIASNDANDLRTLYFYCGDAGADGFRGNRSYANNPTDYLRYLLNTENGFDGATRTLARAVINNVSAILVYRASEKYGGNEIQLQNLPNEGYAYTEEELSPVTKESFTDMIVGENKAQTQLGKITGLSVKTVTVPDNPTRSLSFTLKFTYTGKEALYVNGALFTGGGITVDGTLSTAALDVCVLFNAGEEWARVYISPFALIALRIGESGAKSYEKKLYKSVYYLKVATDAYLAK